LLVWRLGQIEGCQKSHELEKSVLDNVLGAWLWFSRFFGMILSFFFNEVVCHWPVFVFVDVVKNLVDFVNSLCLANVESFILSCIKVRRNINAICFIQRKEKLIRPKEDMIRNIFWCFSYSKETRRKIIDQIRDTFKRFCLGDQKFEDFDLIIRINQKRNESENHFNEFWMAKLQFIFFYQSFCWE